MSNLCSIQKPAEMSNEAWASFLNATWGSWTGWASLTSNTYTVPFVFDADQVHISCIAFANNASSGTLLSYQTQINSLQTTIAGLNTQIASLVAGNTVAPPNTKIISAEMAIFGALVACAAAIYGMKRILNLFTSHPDS